MDDVEIKIINAPVGQLLSADWLYLLAVVERVPQLADEEELLTLD